MKRTLVMLCALPVVLAGCYTSRGIDIGEPPTATPTTSSAAPATLAQSGPQPLGTTRNLTGQGTEADVTVFAVVQNVAPNAPMPQGGGHWSGADVQTCVKKADSPFTVAGNDWSAFDAKDGAYDATNDVSNVLPPPPYPFNSQPVADGQCVRGWVLFPVSFGTAVVAVKYKPNSDTPTVWSVTP